MKIPEEMIETFIRAWEADFGESISLEFAQSRAQDMLILARLIVAMRRKRGDVQEQVAADPSSDVK